MLLEPCKGNNHVLVLYQVFEHETIQQPIYVGLYLQTLYCNNPKYWI
jgi:hypothetical protein